MQLTPFFQREHNAVTHRFFEDILQRYLRNFSNNSGADPTSVLIRVIQPFSSLHPHCHVKIFHCETWP